MTFLVIAVRDGLAVITMNRPETRNAVGQPADAAEFRDACLALNEDPSVRCAILTGAGASFSAGGDVKGMRSRAGPQGQPALDHHHRYRRQVHTIVRALHGLEMPLIAAVNGPAIGLGCDLACLADIRLASETARFGVTFLALGVIPGDGGAWILPRIVGQSRASEMLFSARTLDATTALDWGLVSEICPPEALLDRAYDLAQRICQHPAYALRMVKSLLRQGQTASFETMLELSAASQAICHTTPEHVEGLDALLERRPANFARASGAQ